jgi:hypothetical protein
MRPRVQPLLRRLVAQRRACRNNTSPFVAGALDFSVVVAAQEPRVKLFAKAPEAIRPQKNVAWVHNLWIHSFLPDASAAPFAVLAFYSFFCRSASSVRKRTEQHFGADLLQFGHNLYCRPSRAFLCADQEPRFASGLETTHLWFRTR